nr:DsrE family protein [uncultured Marinifilum sp.]
MDKLNILWTSNDRDTFFNMLSMYSINSKKRGWWENVNVIIWGASVKLAGNDTQIQSEIMEMIHSGIRVEACRNCAENFGVSEKLEKLGVKVHYMGIPMTEYLKNGEKILSI